MSSTQESRPQACGLKLPWTITQAGTPTDIDIEQAVVDALRRCPTLSNYNIEVSVSNGQVKLNGKVKHWDNRRLAGDAAWSVYGVKDVSNFLVVEIF